MARNTPSHSAPSVGSARGPSESPSPRTRCLVCGADLVASELYQSLRVCPRCRFHYSMAARERIQSLVDPGTFRETNRSVVSLDPLSFSSRLSYKQRLLKDQRRTGLTEAAVTGTCLIGGSPSVLIVLDFGFMGGTMGCVVGEKVALALEHAGKRKLPVVAVVTSGGARIQEGALSLVQMAKTAISATHLDDQGLPFISVLANPATGQAYASFANLADIILAEPGALVGVSSLREMREDSADPLPSGAHTAEAHLEHGMLDGTVDRARLREVLAMLLDLLGPQYVLEPAEGSRVPRPEVQHPEPWDTVRIARHEDRPTARDYIQRVFTGFVEIRGDRAYGDDPAVVCGLARLGGQTVAVIGQQRGRGGAARRNQGRAGPEGFRKAQRAIRLAAKFHAPLITLIDTPGAQTSPDAEVRGLGNAIATTMAAMGAVRVPSIAVIVGEGGAEAALALAVADRILMFQNAIFTVISPEDAAELVYQDQARAAEVATFLKLTAQDCRELGIVDELIPEPPGGAHKSPDDAARQLRRDLVRHLAELQQRSTSKLLRERYKKFRNMGEYTSHFRAAIAREANALQGFVATSARRIARRGRRKAVERAGPADLASDEQAPPE